ncbi:AraC family transcriptional regulator [Pseudoxanthomonas mexicana]|uniref:AraC family transcriptional regulator n=1 Tax=Pseudoxanthomonas mexicana TaxID=128785 RepID=UPI003CE4E7EB
MTSPDAYTAAAACHAAGFESTPQFNREFQRHFGMTPAEEVRRMRDGYVLRQRPPNSAYVSSH